MYIYKLTAPNGKVYIGQTNNIKERFKKYKGAHCQSQTKLYRSLKKYGWENFDKKVLVICEECEADRHEIELIKIYKSLEKGLNCEYGGNKLKKMSEESKKKMSISAKGKTSWMKGKKHTEESKEKNRISHLGKTQSEESNKKRSEALKGRKSPMKGKKQTQKWKDAMKKAHTGKKYCLGHKSSDGHKEKLRIAQTGKKHSVETKLKMSISAKNRNKKGEN